MHLEEYKSQSHMNNPVSSTLHPPKSSKEGEINLVQIKEKNSEKNSINPKNLKMKIEGKKKKKKSKTVTPRMYRRKLH